MPNNPVDIAGVKCGQGQPFVLIAGPCVIESEELVRTVCKKLVAIRDELGIQLVFKASFDKANRTSVHSYRGPGIEAGLKVLEKIKQEFHVPVTTDVHEREHCRVAKDVIDLLQIPAFLARQTDLLVAAGETGRAVNVKKGQFMAPKTCGTWSPS